MMKEQTYMEEGREPVFFGFVGFFRLGVRRLSPRELEKFPHAVRRAERQPDKPFTFNPINLDESCGLSRNCLYKTELFGHSLRRI